ncbi:GNAT family N-acetyltransferase [Lichenibacterium dinghuense]|uniref:GNAT family N-acetyltransferase n=1 Tax=Lichenibacterium dinghuense TaxID=2895977 RepID=UPI001F46B7A3|nr:GNAT family N-acetyltransferase [Lichenibacterium sp. 6Y81]
MDEAIAGPEARALIEIRRLVPGDAPAYVAFRLAALAVHPAAFTSSAEEERMRPLSWAEARIRDPARPDDFILGAFAGERLAGTAGLKRGVRPKERHKATLFGMAVAQEAGGRGIGGLLVDRLVAEARAVPGLLQVGLTVSEGNAAAERLYAARGFVVFGREPRGVIVDGVPIAKLHMALMLDAPAAGG